MYSCLERTRGRTGVRQVTLCGVALATLLGAAGCAQQQQRQPSTPPPMVVDEAMQRRDWEPSVAYIPSGNFVAGVNRFPLRTPGNYTAAATPDYGGAAADYAASLAQMVALPFTYLFVPPFEAQQFSSDELGPTHTGMPEMRPAQGLTRVDDVLVNPETLEVVRPPSTERQMEEHQRRGPLGPGDTEFMSSPPSPARQ